MKREVSLDSQGAQGSGSSWENCRLTSDLAYRDAYDDGDEVADVSVQVDFPADVITYDSDDETMGRKRFSAFRTKKSGMPVYSKEDIREQYCITNKQLHVLETAAQARMLFGCIPKEDNWKSCHRASLLSSCLRKPKSASDENLASSSTSTMPMAWEPLPPEMQGRSPRAVSQQIASASVVAAQDGGSTRPPPSLSQRQTVAAASPRDLRQTFDEELANAVMRRRAKLSSDSFNDATMIEKRHTWAVEGDVGVVGSKSFRQHVDGTEGSNGSLVSRPNLLRLRSQDSAASIVSDATGIEGVDGKRYAITMPNTPDLSHSVARRQMSNTQEMTLEERRQKHVSFDCAALIRSHPTISDSGQQRRSQLDALTSPPMRRLNSTTISPDRNRSQERLLDMGTQRLTEYFHYHQQSHHHPQRRRLGSVRSLDFMSGWSPKVHPIPPVMKPPPPKPMKTQATQTEAAVAEKVSIPAPVLAYLTLSPRAHGPSEPSSTSPSIASSQSGRTFQNGKRLVKSRSDSEYKIRDDSDVKMTVIHLDDTALLARKRTAVRTRSSPLTTRRKSQKEIMVVFKPQEDSTAVNANLTGNSNQQNNNEILPRREKKLSTVTSVEDEENAGSRLPSRRERSESDPFELDEAEGDDRATANGRRTRSLSEEGRGSTIGQITSSARGDPKMEHPEGKKIAEPHEQNHRVLIAASRDSEESGNQECPSVTDPSTSCSVTSSTRSSASRDFPDGTVVNVDKSFSSSSSVDNEDRGRSSARRGRLRDKESSERDGSGSGAGSGSCASGDEVENASTLSEQSSGEVDKTVSYSSDTDFASIKSDTDSHTLVDANSTESLLQGGTAVQRRHEKPDDIVSNKPNIEMTGKLKSFIKDRLTSPESESSSGKMRSQATDSSKSETSEDYHTATEHSHADVRLKQPSDIVVRHNPIPKFGTADDDDDELSPFIVMRQQPAIATCVLEEWPPDGTMDTSHEFTAEDVSVVTVQELLRSPRASSTLSMESSTSGSYTLEGSDPNLRKLSSGTVSDSDKELGDIFSSQGDVFYSGCDQRDGGIAPIWREYDRDDKQPALTPTPDVQSTKECAVVESSEPASIPIEQQPDESSAATPEDEESSEKMTSSNLSAASEVTESGYNFKEIRSRFERLVEHGSLDDGRMRSSSVETTDGSLSTSLGSDSKPSLKKKTVIVKAIPCRPTSGEQRPDRAASFSEVTQHGSARSRSPVSADPAETSDHGRHALADKPSKGFRRSVSESPDTAVGIRPAEKDDVFVGGSGGGAKSKRSIVDGAEPWEELRAGKKHKSRSHEKDSGHSKRKSAKPIDAEEARHRSPPTPAMPSSEEPLSSVIVVRSVSSSPDRCSPKCVHDDSNVQSSEQVTPIPPNFGHAKPRSASSSGMLDNVDEDDDGDDFRSSSRRMRCERSLPGSTERLEDHHRRSTTQPLTERPLEIYEVSKMLCTECGEKIRRIHGHEHHESHADRSSHVDELLYPMTSQEISALHGPSVSGHLGGVPKYSAKVKSTPEGLADTSTSFHADPAPHSVRSKSVSGHDSSTESLLIGRSPASTSALFECSSAGTSSSWATDAASVHDVMHEEEDEDVGIYAESYRASAWIYIGDNEELVVWKGRPESEIAGSDKPDDDAKSLSSVSSAPAALSVAVAVEVLQNPSPSPIHRTDSLESTASERDFRRRYQAITHRMIHRKSSVEMYKRLSNKTFECDKTVVVLRKSGEFGFRIHGSRPVVVSAIEPGTPAETSGLEIGDIVIAVNGVNVLDASHSEVVKIAHTGSETLHLDVARTCHILTPVVSDAESQKPVHSGFLYKMSGGGGGVSLMKKWCRRWFILKRDHCLYYYKQETSKEPLGAIMLLNYTVSRAIEVGRPHAFRVSKYGAASYCFAAEEEDSMTTWANLINEASNSAGQCDPWIEVSSRNVQLPALSIHNPDCHGYLAKLGQRWKTWRRRYCVLKDACIYYYHDVTSVTSLGVAHLHGYRVQSCTLAGRKHVFEVIPPEPKMRHVHFSADNDTDKKRWLAALEYSIDRWIKVG